MGETPSRQQQGTCGEDWNKGRGMSSQQELSGMDRSDRPGHSL